MRRDVRQVSGFPSPVIGTLHGTDAVKIFDCVEPEDDVLATAEAFLSLSYEMHLGPVGRRFLEDSFALIRNALKMRECLGDLFAGRRATFRDLGLLKSVRYKRASLTRTAHLLAGPMLRGTVVDVGAGANMLGPVLLEASPEVRRIVGVDIIPPDSERGPTAVEFRRQPAEHVLPMLAASADVAVFRYSLHHMSVPTQDALLAEAVRVLRPGGALAIVEDTWSESIPPLVANTPLERFFALDGMSRRLVLACLDASSCLIEEEVMPFCFTFRTMEEWQVAACAVGFTPAGGSFWGLPFFSLYQAPMGISWFRR